MTAGRACSATETSAHTRPSTRSSALPHTRYIPLFCSSPVPPITKTGMILSPCGGVAGQTGDSRIQNKIVRGLSTSKAPSLHTNFRPESCVGSRPRKPKTSHFLTPLQSICSGRCVKDKRHRHSTRRPPSCARTSVPPPPISSLGRFFSRCVCVSVNTFCGALPRPFARRAPSATPAHAVPCPAPRIETRHCAAGAHCTARGASGLLVQRSKKKDFAWPCFRCFLARAIVLRLQ